MATNWKSITFWRPFQKEMLVYAIERNAIFKVHRYNEKAPAYIVKPEDIKTNLRRIAITRFEVLRRDGAFYPPEISGNHYLFFIRDEIKSDPCIFDMSIPRRSNYIINMINDGWSLRGKVNPDGTVTTFHFFKGDEKKPLHSAIGVKAEEKGVIYPSPQHNGFVWYELNPQYIRS